MAGGFCPLAAGPGSIPVLTNERSFSQACGDFYEFYISVLTTEDVDADPVIG
jgi:hypothetical protein